MFNRIAFRFMLLSLVGLGWAMTSQPPARQEVDPFMLALSCSDKHIKPKLKDPDSFRRLSYTHRKDFDTIDVTVNYSATNSFGGRVAGDYTCSYGL